MKGLPIGRFHGIGPVTEAKLKRLGIHFGRDLKSRPLDALVRIFGSSAPYYYGVARGIDERPVRAHRVRKSVGAETTFSHDTGDIDLLTARLQPLLDKVWETCEGRNLPGRTVTLKLKFSDFVQITRARSLPDPVRSRDALAEVCLRLLRDAYPLRRDVRLVGVSLSGFDQSAAVEQDQLGFGI